MVLARLKGSLSSRDVKARQLLVSLTCSCTSYAVVLVTVATASSDAASNVTVCCCTLAVSVPPGLVLPKSSSPTSSYKLPNVLETLLGKERTARSSLPLLESDR